MNVEILSPFFQVASLLCQRDFLGDPDATLLERILQLGKAAKTISEYVVECRDNRQKEVNKELNSAHDQTRFSAYKSALCKV